MTVLLFQSRSMPSACKHLDEAQKVEWAISYLERDDYSDGSGYLKETIWRRIKLISLKEKQKERLRGVALQYLQRKMTREFWNMCRCANAFSDEAFRHRVQELADADDPAVRCRAAPLLAYLESPEAGERSRHEFKGRPRIY